MLCALSSLCNVSTLFAVGEHSCEGVCCVTQGNVFKCRLTERSGILRSLPLNHQKSRDNKSLAGSMVLPVPEEKLEHPSIKGDFSVLISSSEHFLGATEVARACPCLYSWSPQWRRTLSE